MNIKDMKGALPVGKEKKEPELPKKLTTVWGDALDGGHVRGEYPRPRMVRENFTMLNGYWDYAITRGAVRPSKFDGRILVPFSPECSLSGVERQLRPNEYLWYEREVGIEKLRPGQRLILHFGAVDQCALVFINGRAAARHVGGYLPFSADVTDYFNENDEHFTLTVRVQDYTDTSYHSRGKQKLEPGGMYYTAQSGIWKSVWMERVPAVYIEDVCFEALPALYGVRLKARLCGKKNGPLPKICVHVFEPTMSFDIDDPGDEYEEERTVALYESFAEGDSFDLIVMMNDAKHWSADAPWLYPAEIVCGEDRVRSYFAIRSFCLGKDSSGRACVLQNGTPVFLNGVLDQGYWPDGLYTAPSDEAFIFDIMKMKELGFNMLRKHAKIEDERWYYHCDRLGMIVWQDMVNGGGYYSPMLLTYLPTGLCVPGPLKKKDEGKGSGKPLPQKGVKLMQGLTGREERAGREEFKKECAATVELLKFHPCVMTWVIFNEGWGQFETENLTRMLQRLDPGRLIDSASGWFEVKCGDFKSIHNYFRKLKVPRDTRAVVISEYGGYVYHIDEHSMYSDTYGYHTCDGAEGFEDEFLSLMTENVAKLKSKGLCGAVYTQLSDIEEETNGLLTYDRRVCKISGESAKHLRDSFY